MIRSLWRTVRLMLLLWIAHSLERDNPDVGTKVFATRSPPDQERPDIVPTGHRLYLLRQPPEVQ